MKESRRLAPVLAIVASATGFLGLVPLAFIMPRIATALFPLGSAVFFLEVLSGPLLLLASGLRAIAVKFSTLRFLMAFAALVIVGGLLPLLALEWHGLLVDWVAMSIAISLIAAALRRRWLWAVVGGAWQGVLLAAMSVGSAVTFLSPGTFVTPWVPLLWLLGCILALSSGIVAFVRRKGAY